MSANEQLIFKGGRNYNALVASCVILALVLGLSYYIISPYYHNSAGGGLFAIGWKDLMRVIVAVVCIPYLLLQIFSKTPALSVDQGHINFDGQSIPFNTIYRIDTAFLANASKNNEGAEAVEIKLKNGQEVIIKIGVYANGSEFRNVCDKISANISKGIYNLEDSVSQVNAETAVTNDNLSSEQFEKFLSNPFRAFAFWLVIFFWVTGVILFFDYDISIKNRLMGLGLFIILGLVSAYPLNYFLVSANYMVVQHHIYFWKKVILPIKTLKRISTTFVSREGYSILILTSDNQSKTIYTDMLFKSSLTDLVDTVTAYISKR